MTRPAVPPYSSSTIAMWTLRRWNSWSRSSTLIDSGTKTGVRRIERRLGALLDRALEERQQVLGVEDADDLVDRVLVDRDPAVALLDDDVDRLLHRGGRGERDHRDARDHDLVDALVAELDDRVDHLLLLGLEDALLAAALDEDRQLFGAHHVAAWSPAPSMRDTLVGDRGQDADERPEDAQQDVDEAAQPERERSAWARARLLGTSSPKTIVKRLRISVTMISARAPADEARMGRPDPTGRSRLAVRLTAAYAEARKPRKVSPIWVTARKRPGCGDQALDPLRAPVALVDELVDARPAHARRARSRPRRRRPRRGSG